MLINMDFLIWFLIFWQFLNRSSKSMTYWITLNMYGVVSRLIIAKSSTSNVFTAILKVQPSYQWQSHNKYCCAKLMSNVDRESVSSISTNQDIWGQGCAEFVIHIIYVTAFTYPQILARIPFNILESSSAVFGHALMVICITHEVISTFRHSG